MIMKYKEVPAYKDMVKGIIYVRRLENGDWEAKGMAQSGKVYGISTDESDSITLIVQAVQNSMDKDDHENI